MTSRILIAILALCAGVASAPVLSQATGSTSPKAQEETVRKGADSDGAGGGKSQHGTGAARSSSAKPVAKSHQRTHGLEPSEAGAHQSGHGTPPSAPASRDQGTDSSAGAVGAGTGQRVKPAP